MSNLKIFEVMADGKPVSKQDAEAAIKSLEKMLKEAREKGPESYADRIEDSISRIREYRKRNKPKSRPVIEIQKDIEAAQEMIYSYRMNRLYDLAARWEYNRDEYKKEYDAALIGKRYAPDLKEVEGIVRTRVPEGFQVCL